MCDELRDELVRDEGLRLNSYKDTVGLWTIGVGHLLGAEERMRKLTTVEAYALLESDVLTAKGIVAALFPNFKTCTCGGAHKMCEPDTVRYRALVNMAFNLGNHLAGFKKFVAAVNKQDWKTAAIEMMDSRWAGQVGDRAQRLAYMITHGEVRP